MPLGNPNLLGQIVSQQNLLMAETMLTMLTLLSQLMSNGTLPNLLSAQSGGAIQGLGGASPVGGGGRAGGTFSGSKVNTPTVPGGPKVQKFIDVAMAQQGDPYVFGATGPDKFDCSGLVYYSLKQAGANVPRLTAEGYRQRYKSSMVDKSELRPGDLVFYWSPNSRGIPQGHATHIEIYIGNGQTMGTDNPSEGARVEPVNWKTFIGAARPTELYQ